jgi:hypothetical protein
VTPSPVSHLSISEVQGGAPRRRPEDGGVDK